MYMSKHPANALIALGIIICVGFLSAPATAGSDYGLAALESGSHLQFPYGGLLGAVKGSKDRTTQEPSIPIPHEETPTLTNAVIPAGSADRYDDERLVALINTAGIRLMRLSMEHAHALYLQDTVAASTAADDLYALSTRLIVEAQSLQVSPGQQSIKDEFIRLLETYSSVSRELLNAQGSAPAAIRDLAGASEGLEAVSLQVDAPMMRGAAATALAASGQTTSPQEILPLQTRHLYDDPSGENMVSLLVESTRTAQTYHTVPINASAAKVEAGEGRVFLLVTVKSTNLGHKGNSALYTIETPGRNAFTLEYQEAAFTPLDVPAFTSLGESFDQKTLDRYESLKGYLYFDVPASLNVSEAILRADIGHAGTPAWALGRCAGEHSQRGSSSTFRATVSSTAMVGLPVR